MEIWKEVKGYEGLYQVSNLGRIKRHFKNGKENILNGKIDKDGYIEVILSKNQNKKYCRLHRLVACAFISNPDDKAEVNHKDRNKRNNDVCNLEWVTPSENVRHTFLTGRKIRTRAVVQYNKNMELVAEFDSLKEASKKIKLKQNNISTCCNGKQKTVGGYIWRYKVGDNI